MTPAAIRELLMTPLPVSRMIQAIERIRKDVHSGKSTQTRSVPRRLSLKFERR